MGHDRVPQHKRRLATDREDIENADQELKEKVSEKSKSKEKGKRKSDSKQRERDKNSEDS